MEPTIIVHGGAYNILDENVDNNVKGACAAVRRGYEVLKTGSSCVEAVIAAISSLEDDPTFDAGHGSVLNIDGNIEMDCLLMRGSDKKTASVMCASKVCNPIQLAGKLLDQNDLPCSVSYDQADCLAEQFLLPTTTKDELITAEALQEWRRLAKFKHTIDDVFRARSDVITQGPCDTVGCVAFDCHGNIACGTSTGGITAKLVGRVGDSPLVGCGGYCDDEVGGVSTTGHGEAITKMCMAYEIIENMKAGMLPHKAIEAALVNMDSKVKDGHGGAIAIDKFGNIGMHFNTPRMIWASMKDNKLQYGINSKDHPFTSTILSTNHIPAVLNDLRKSHIAQAVLVLEAKSAASADHLQRYAEGLNLMDGMNSFTPQEYTIKLVEALEKRLVKKDKGYLYDSLVCHGINGASASSVSGVPSPVNMANLVRQNTRHTMIVDEGVKKLDIQIGHHDQEEFPNGVSEPVEQLDSSWTIGALVLDSSGSAYCAVTCSRGADDYHINSLGCRAYAENGIGVALALGDSAVLCRHVLPKALIQKLSVGEHIQPACDQIRSMVLDNFPQCSVDLVGIDSSGTISHTLIKTDDRVRLVTVGITPH